MKTSNALIQGRYTGLIASVGIFMLLIFILLAFTFYTSNLLQKNTALINETNKVSNNAQSVIKDLFDLQNSHGESIRSPHMQRVLARLQATSDNMTQSMDIIENGGEVTEAHGSTMTLSKLTDEAALADLKAAKGEWGQLQPKITKYLEHAQDITVDSSDELTLAVDQAKTSSLLMTESLNTLVDDVFVVSEEQANRIRLIQIIGVVAILAYFLVFIFFFIRRLRESDAESIEARRETEEIMQTVSTGLFLLDKDLNIGNQYSKALEGIMGTENLAGENFTTILRNRISDKDLDTTRQFIEQLYNPRVKTKLVNDLNPLNKVMLHNETDGSASDRYLDFRFSRVYENKNIARILVNVNDVTDAVMLEQRLEKEREQNDLQIEMLTTILNVNPALINQFIRNTKVHIEKINETLKSSGSSQGELQEKLSLIYREIHSLKGDSSSLKLHSFTQIATDAENKLHAMRGQLKLSGNDFLPLAVYLDDLLNLSNTIETLGERINASNVGNISLPELMQTEQDESDSVSMNVLSSGNEISLASSTEAAKPATENTATENLNDVYAKQYLSFAQEIAERQNKEVKLITKGFDKKLSDDVNSLLNTVIIQLLRNSIVHGIETPAVREINGKQKVGTINLGLTSESGMLVLTIEDDGAGINYPAIREKLVSLGHYDSESVRELTKGKLLNALFSSGFSTKNDADEDGGRGVGLDIIKDKIKENNGKINVHSEAGKMTRFTISFPE